MPYDECVTLAPHSKPLEFHDIDDVAAALRDAGGRLTTPRRLVLEALFAAGALVPAEHIAAGTDTGVTLDVTSVYRNLENSSSSGSCATSMSATARASTG